MRVIGLTGGIACGKSSLAHALHKYGAHIIDADAISRALTAPGGKALHAIQRVFGDVVLMDNGALNRAALADIIFNDTDKRCALNAILHPMIKEEMERQVEQACAAGAKIVILDVPLLYESGMDTMADEVWCAYLPKAEQVKRLMARDGLSRQKALFRINSQLPLKEKCKRAAHVIDTRGALEESARQVLLLYNAAVESDGVIET